TSSLESTNSSSVNIETTNSLDLELIPFYTELFLIKPNNKHDLQLLEIKPNDEQDFQSSEIESNNKQNLQFLEIEPNNEQNQLFSSKVVAITSIEAKHNHQMQLDVSLYASRYKKLSLEILDLIEYYITKKNMRSKQILSLLIAKFSDHMIYKTDLYNAVKKVRKASSQCYEEQQCLIHYIDIVQTDNTCKTNWFDIYLTLLIVINNNTKTQLICQAFSDDKTTEAYKWFFECVKNAAYNTSLAVLFSDVKLTLSSAISLKLPTTYHFLYFLYSEKHSQKFMKQI
ncbi:20818_t:CDS:2, partial [Cetraspora pellucida]